MTTESSYVPGMCNINTAEIAYRRKARNIGAALSVALFVVLLVTNAPWWLTAIVLFLPVIVAAVGVLQVRNKFCVSYGASGKQNADESSAAAHSVSDQESLAADRAKARKMNLQALGATILVCAVAAVLTSVVSL